MRKIMHMRLMETFILNRGDLKGTGSCYISLLMNYDQVHVFISARKKKTSWILRFGKVLKKEKLLGILFCVKAVSAGISNARQWIKNTSVKRLIFMQAGRT